MALHNRLKPGLNPVLNLGARPQIAQQDGIDLEANLSSMLEKEEVEKDTLSHSAQNARAGEEAEAKNGEELVESRTRVRELEAALTAAQTEASHRLEWMQVSVRRYVLV